MDGIQQPAMTGKDGKREAWKAAHLYDAGFEMVSTETWWLSWEQRLQSKGAGLSSRSKNEKLKSSQAWWYAPVISALRRSRQAIMSWGLGYAATQGDCLKTKPKRNRKKGLITE